MWHILEQIEMGKKTPELFFVGMEIKFSAGKI